jgi:hypothetical protein
MQISQNQLANNSKKNPLNFKPNSKRGDFCETQVTIFKDELQDNFLFFNKYIYH